MSPTLYFHQHPPFLSADTRPCPSKSCNGQGQQGIPPPTSNLVFLSYSIHVRPRSSQNIPPFYLGFMSGGFALGRQGCIAASVQAITPCVCRSLLPKLPVIQARPAAFYHRVGMDCGRPRFALLGPVAAHVNPLVIGSFAHVSLQMSSNRLCRACPLACLPEKKSPKLLTPASFPPRCMTA